MTIVIWILTLAATLLPVLNVFTLHHALKAREALRIRNQNGIRIDIAQQGIRREVLLIVAQLALTSGALMLYPYLRAIGSRPDIAFILVRQSLIVIASGLLGLNSLLDLRGRRRIIERIHSMEHQRRPV